MSVLGYGVVAILIASYWSVPGGLAWTEPAGSALTTTIVLTVFQAIGIFVIVVEACWPSKRRNLLTLVLAIFDEIDKAGGDKPLSLNPNDRPRAETQGR
jgi:hypothetical protein